MNKQALNNHTKITLDTSQMYKKTDFSKPVF